MQLGALPAAADDVSGKTASVYGYALNDTMFKYKVMSVKNNGDFIENHTESGIAPSGVIYSDIVQFEKEQCPYLVIWRADGVNRKMCIDVFGYNDENSSAELIVTLKKGYKSEFGALGEFTLGTNGDERYLIYNEYYNGSLASSEYYTIINKTAFKYVCSPDYAEQYKITAFDSVAVYPETDLTDFNRPLDNFFAELKNASADSVTYDEIADLVKIGEIEKIENALESASKFVNFNMCNYETLDEYNAALKNPDADNIFYSITHLYDLDDELYYVRFATNNSFYNYALLRRSDEAENGYQLLAVRTDSIPLSDTELKSNRDDYLHSNLLMKKSRGSIEESHGLFSADKEEPEKDKPIKIPSVINKRLRQPIALIGGGVCLALLAALWIVMSYDDDTPQ